MIFANGCGDGWGEWILGAAPKISEPPKSKPPGWATISQFAPVPSVTTAANSAAISEW